ncbi:helix-turn-helix domain-containing protein [Nocardiopsis sp. Huas11]|uniref:helix-turn-helix domain-containing protein n=1 Tax=Nocardiopsis sp. Huas11 TaxID=2183912 RepID=UPI0026C9BEC1
MIGPGRTREQGHRGDPRHPQEHHPGPRSVGETGLTPLAWLNRQRVARARELLETTDLPVAVVAQRSGLGTGDGLRLHFRRHLGTTPSAYRRAFRGPGPA